MQQRLHSLLALFLTLGISSQAQTVVEVTDASLLGDQTYNWTNDNIYLLDGLVYLEAGGTLNIEEGTVIKAKGNSDVTTGDNTSALIITRDAQIFAEGTADDPIIFTAAADDTDDPDDLDANDKGLWGGLILLGKGVIARPGGEDGIEGIDAGESRARFGGTDNEDDSGTLRYISIRHGGAALSPGDEINGLTLGGVGSGTIIEYVEVLSNLDDGIEFFGGTVSVKYASIAFCGDDSFDWDYGWRGSGQFWFSIQGTGPGDVGRGGEHDGANPDGQTPFSQPTIYNATYIGSGTDPMPFPGGDGNNLAVLFRDNTGGSYNNSIFTGFAGAGIAIEDRDDTADGDAYARFQDGDLILNNNFFFDFADGNSPADLWLAWDQDENVVAASSIIVADALMTAGNIVTDPGIAGISRTPNNMLDPRIDAGAAALNPIDPPTDDFFNSVTFRGAFGNNNLWIAGWTALDEYGYLGDLVDPVVVSADCIEITDADLVAGETYNWSATNCYLLDGLVFLEAGATLNIEAGTVVKAKSSNDVSTGDNTSALIIARDATINVLGSDTDPVIFTADSDDVSDPFDLGKNDRGLWGGLIVLGNATIARPGGEDGIEGIDAGELRARFGGSDDADNSGIIRYLSIRHGGAALSPGDEINGLTLGGVGSGTEIEHVEVLSNLDDGIELFGGTVGIKYAAVAFCGDDSYDWDYGWRGKGQFWFSLSDVGPGDVGRAGEHDGANPDSQAPFSQPTIYNATYIGSGTDPMPFPGGDGNDVSVVFRDNTGGSYTNSIFTDFPGSAIAVEDRDDTTDGDAFARLQAGDLALNNNIFFGFGAGATPSDLFLAWDDGENLVSSSTDVINILAASGNEIIDPNIISISRDDNRMLDPRPAFGPATSGAMSASDDFFSPAAYYGAFNPEAFGTWLHGWTALDEYEFLAQPTTSVDNPVAQNGFLLDAPAPTPSYGLTTLSFELARPAQVNLEVYDLMGRRLTTIANRFYGIGQQFETFDVSDWPNGMYTILLRAEGIKLVQKIIVAK